MLLTFEHLVRTACDLNVEDVVQPLAERDHTLYSLICVLRGFRDRLFDHLVAHAHVQPAVFRFIAERLDIVVRLCRLFRGRRFVVIVKPLRQVSYRLGKGVFQLPAVRLDRRVDSAV